jgi:hypothetical protein
LGVYDPRQHTGHGVDIPMVNREAVGIDFCDWFDAPVYLEAVLVQFVVWAALVVMAVRFSRRSANRRVLVGVIVFLSVWSSLMTYNWGIAADRVTCATAYDDNLTLAILSGLNLLLIAAARTASRRWPRI